MCCNAVIVLSVPSSVHIGLLLVLTSHLGKVWAQQKAVGSLQKQKIQLRPVCAFFISKGGIIIFPGVHDTEGTPYQGSEMKCNKNRDVIG